MAHTTISFYCNAHNKWIIKKALEHCKKTHFTFKNKELKSDTDILKLGLEMIRQYFGIKKPMLYKEFKDLEGFLNE